MSISTRIFIILLFGFVAYALVVVLAQRTFVAPSFQELEQRQARLDMTRVFSYLDNEIAHLGSLSRDWAAWDDTYGFVAGNNEHFPDANLLPLVFQDLGINLIAIYDHQGEVVWSRVYDLEAGKYVRHPDFPDQGRIRYPELLLPPKAVTGRWGVFADGAAPLLLAAEPITDSNAEAPPNGTMFMGRFIDSELVENISENVRLDVSLWSVSGQEVPLPVLDQATGMALDDPPRVTPISKDQLRVLALYPDMFGRPALLTGAVLDRPITARGHSAQAFHQLTVLLGGMAVLAAVLISLQLLVIRPVSLLTAQVMRRSQSEDPLGGGERLALDRSDEIGDLSRGFETLLESLAQARDQVRKSAYLTGKSEMARGLLHNLRNTMTPLISRLDMVLDELRSAPLEDRETAKRELAEGDLDPERRAKLKTFLALSADRDAELLGQTIEKLTGLARQADAVERVVNDFERFTRAETLTEAVVLEDMVQEALDLLPANLRAYARLDTVINLPEGQLHTTPPIFLQVLVHLLANAAESVAVRFSDPEYGPPAEGDGPFIIVRAWLTDQGVRISVEDKGMGIAPEDIKRIFERDYSTSTDPSRGFGLHWCSGVLNQLGGRLTAQSPGPGQGSTFTILLPHNPERG